MNPCVVVVVLGASAFSAAAQQDPAARPEDPRAAVPSVDYQSAFKSYIGYREEPLRPWREINEDVNRAGGHAGIFGTPPPAGRGENAKAHPAQPATKPTAKALPEPAGKAPGSGAPTTSAHEHKGPH